MGSATNCLQMAGDGDEIDLLEDVEKAFGITLSDAEALRCETVGELFDVVASKLDVSLATHLGCPTALTFFRLRAALRRLGHRERVTPRTNLRALFNGSRGRWLYARLQAEAGLRLPALEFHPGASVGSALIAVASSAWLGSWLALFGFVPFLIVLGMILPKRIAGRIASLGDFSAFCAALNYGTLAQQAGGARLRDVWTAVTTLVRYNTGFNGEIYRDTRFFPAR